MKYRLIAVDLDGTLLNGSGKLSRRNLAAIRAAQEAGVMVVPCTGRGWCEAREAVAELGEEGASSEFRVPGSKFRPSAIRHPTSDIPRHPHPSPLPRKGEGVGVFTGGSAVCDLLTGAALNLAFMDPNLALELMRHLSDAADAVLVYRDLAAVGHDYLVTGRGTLSPNTQWWFEATGATVHFQKDPGLDDARHVLRVGMVGLPARLAAAAVGVSAAFGRRVVVQSFPAVQRPSPEECVDVLEIFAAGVDKWRGLAWIAARHGWDAGQVAAIGDGVNDLAMLAGAGCGIAMANSPPAVKAASRHVTLDCDQDGVAFAIEQLLGGGWG